MKKWLPLLLILCLTGCATEQPNDHGFAISLSVDGTESGGLEIAVQIPTNSSGSSDGSGGSQGDYILLSAAGASFSEALDLLEATAQREMNLSQLKTIVFSHEVASSANFPDLLTEIVMTYQLYGAALFVVSMTSAKALVSAQKPVIGLRLSNTMTAALAHYGNHGYAPRTTLADAFFRFCSVYGDPVGILAATADTQHTRLLPEGEMGDAYPGSLPRTGPNVNEYFGAALFSGNRMVGVLDGMQTKLLNALIGNIRSFSYMQDDLALEVSVQGYPRVTVDVSGDDPLIDVYMRLRAIAVVGEPDTDALARALTDAYDALTRHCQAVCSEPFGFAEVAAGHFWTLEAWSAYDWHSRFPRALVRYHLSVE